MMDVGCTGQSPCMKKPKAVRLFAAQRANSLRIASPWAPTAGDGPSSTFSPANICGGAGIDTGPVGVPMSTRRNCGCRANCPTVLRLPNATFADRSAAVRSA